MFKNKPLCEVCGREDATAFVGFRISGENHVARWTFACANEPADESEAFSIADTFASPEATVNRLAQMHQSGRTDWQPFMDMMVRFREATK